MQRFVGEKDRPMILVVEDNPGDARLIREAIATGSVRSRIHIAADGVEALKFLRREGEHVQAPRPVLILLDLNLPGKSGWDILKELKADPQLRRIAVVIWTSTQGETEIGCAYDLGANCYGVKPLGLDEYLNTIQAIEEFWVTRVQLPRG
jgi:chemotaxis family two-component system response regulator Rcp1